MSAVFLDFATMGADALDPSPLHEVCPELALFDATSADLVAGRIAGADYVFVNKVRLDASNLDAAPAVKFIGLTATGTDNVDLDYCGERGIAVTNIRAYCTQSVVEHVFGAMLALTHNIHRYDKDVRAGAWQRAENFCMLTHRIRELSGLTIGIVGHGVLGKGVAKVAEAFGMEVLIARRVGTEPAADDGRTDLSSLLANADVVTLHCPLTADTQNLIGAKQLEAMKPGSILINTARGGLVNSRALVDALASGEIGAAAIDVLPKEPPVDGDPLLDYEGDNLILTPHIAWGTEEARQNAIDELAANVAAYQRGERRNRVA